MKIARGSPIFSFNVRQVGVCLDSAAQIEVKSRTGKEKNIIIKQRMFENLSRTGDQLNMGLS
jgi:hypothetical protein